ncbi:hypothetical protein [Terrabacter sp. NPDC080008]|uniref:hypothetical protein n=1 Tax=Terrabacter sp. NPDC080008 TaxID=3155176 RepID=UPI00344D32DC
MSSADLAAFLVRAAATLVRLDKTLGPDDEVFRQVAIGDMVDGVPLLDSWELLRKRLHICADPVDAVSEVLSEQATAYCEAAARATYSVVERAVSHLHTAGGEEAAAAFLDALLSEEIAPSCPQARDRVSRDDDRRR